MMKARPHRITVWLAVGMAAGLTLALVGLLRTPDNASGLAPDAAARVSEITISRAALARAVAAVTADRRTPPGADQQRQILKRLVDEALLIEYGLDQDLVRQSPRLRDQLVDVVLSGLRTEAEAQNFSPSEVARFYNSNSALFRGPNLLRVGVIRAADKSRAEAAHAALQSGCDFVLVQAEFSSGVSILPNTALPPNKLRDYLGPGLTRLAGNLDVGQSAGPIKQDNGYVVLQMLARQDTKSPPLAQVETAVRQEMRRRAAESLMQARLAALRQRYNVIVADDLADDAANDVPR